MLFAVSRMWRPVRSKPGPGCLHSHTAVKFINSIILFGGERDGQTLNELWKFHFGKGDNKDNQRIRIICCNLFRIF